ncbi:BREX-2 system adenine-specific DNA-methyltransferase PglX [Streptosporangium sp. NBC_01495]|uniref:BREX-2 system adenine-specific DNA-methyltransferase PglX n=1 Tax=Streptosporangium sp. NBC_01495 TaxID=2903899 RepID=UPI002E30F300|nr:BREX-2 system adenine-specific DNA-methyltransferase PglX [Streptosporangium sp. NBC_01495]
MIDRKALLNDLKQQVKTVEVDLAKQVKAVPEVGTRLRAEYDQARKLGRTAATWTSWLDERVTQVAVAWVLGTVFVRFCEDNELIAEPYLTAPDTERRDLAQARYESYVEEDPDPTYRGWLERAFAELGEGQAGRLLFNPVHNPLFQIPLSHDGARLLVEFWRERDGAGMLVHDFTDRLNEEGTEGWDTRFLGDLYQDLSEAARKTYALLQTPEFVEEFILDRAMDPAVREFGHEELKMIDPTCGSGHFVLGAFRRLVRLWAERDPGRDRHERVAAALDSVHGVDLNPFAVAIARFRLLVAAMAASGVRTMTEAAKYDWPIHLAVGDSLIKERQLELKLGDEVAHDPLAEFAYATEDVHEHPGILEQGRYHVVVGNPPYIAVADESLNKIYRELYNACAGGYALSVPFAQRFFELAKQGDSDGRGYGVIGQITANSFMKREFGVKLIEEFFAHKVELTEIVDTSGAYIPGHATPTVILIGTRRLGKKCSENVRTVRSIQGEPLAPEDGKDGLVWRAITDQIDRPGSVSQWVSVDDLGRERYFGKQPWILVDGGLEMVEQLQSVSAKPLSHSVDAIGRTTKSGADDIFFLPDGATANRLKLKDSVRDLVIGANVRDYEIVDTITLCNPYTDSKGEEPMLESSPLVERYLWLARETLRRRKLFGKTIVAHGRPWYSHLECYPKKLATPTGITFPFVATHNHFVLDRNSRLFGSTAPVIKLREGADEKEYLQLLGLLNSSTAAFWLKMVSQSKGNGGIGGGISDELWEHRFEFTGTKLEEFPLSDEYPANLGATLDALVHKLAVVSPSAIAAAGTITAAMLREAKVTWESVRARMIALQEELDWQVYSLYKLHGEELRISDDVDIPKLALGERAFEIVLARRVARGEAPDEWFKRHGSTPITEIPVHWPELYKQIVQKRIDAIESSRAIGMIERPEYKRRWATEGWDALQEKALRSWLLDRIEAREHWYDENGQPALVTLARLADGLSRDEDFVSVAALYAPRRELVAVVADLLAEEHVPFLAALRYKPSGLKKRADWEHVWDLQRQEDAAQDEPAKRKIRDSIPVPPKYASADFVKASYWRARGKLDVPKERFISYSATVSGAPDLYGWAGWDHREQAQALATYFTNQPLSSEEITPFLAGLLELQPWLQQWHHEFDAMYSGSPAAFFASYRQQIQGEHGLTDEALRDWKPVAATRGRRTAKK